MQVSVFKVAIQTSINVVLLALKVGSWKVEGGSTVRYGLVVGGESKNCLDVEPNQTAAEAFFKCHQTIESISFILFT